MSRKKRQRPDAGRSAFQEEGGADRGKLWLLESLDRVGRAIQGTDDLEQMMRDVLDAVLDIFECDRAWLTFPCDPQAASWHIPMERTRPEYPGANVLGLEVPMDQDVAAVMRTALLADRPVEFGPGSEYDVPPSVAHDFGVQSFVAIAVYPKSAKPYLFGLHQCSYARRWSREEVTLVREIGSRVGDALTSLLTLRNLRRSQRQLDDAQRISHVGHWERDLETDRISWSDETYRIFGLQPRIQTMSLGEWVQLIHPNDRAAAREAVARAVGGGPRYDVEYRVVRPDGDIRVVHSEADVWWDDSGRPRSLFGTVQDITERKRAEDALRRSEADLQLALDAARLGDWKWDIVTGEVIWSARCKALYGLAPDADVTYDRFLAAVHPDDRDRIDAALQHAVEARTGYDMEKRIVWPDGSIRWTIARGRVFCDAAGNPTLMTGVTMDITDRKMLEEAQRKADLQRQESEERFRQLAENIQEVFWLTDVDKKEMLYVSPAYDYIWGRSRDALYADPSQWLDPVHPEDRERVHGAMRDQSQGGYDVEYRIVRSDGETRVIHDRAFPIRDSSGTVYRIAGVAQDVTTQKEQEARIQYLAYHDALTGLPNRALLMNRLDQALAQAQRHKTMLAVLFVDLDRFKTIVDTLGHSAGDALLQQAAVILAGVLREEDTVGRVGGDEFLILAPGLTSMRDAAYVTDKIQKSLSGPFKLEGHELHVTASIGISTYPRDADDAETLVKYADTALYLAKEQGRNTFRFFSPSLDARVRTRLQVENELRYAVERNELLLQYQPQINLETGALTGAECLVRWEHPERGRVPPGDFIPIAEETGLIMPIGDWVLRTASAQARGWQAAGIRDFRLSVNISSRQLDETDFAASVRRVLKATGCDPGLLEFEITESSVMNEPEEVIVKLRALNEIGIQIAMDDFGTGYSSLAFLKRLPLDRLKIDAAFVSGVPDDSDDVAIVQAIIVLARQLRLKVVAEGVETETQRAFLEEHACDEIQGYLISKPLMSHELEALYDFQPA